MAVATPVLERNNVTEEKRTNFGYAEKISDEEHNARIKNTYAMLINPEVNLNQVLGRSVSVNIPEAVAPVRTAAVASGIVQPVAPIERKPYLVDNARADAAIFRADSPVNRRIIGQPQMVSANITDEEESEDLRPTRTTIQYRTKGLQKTVEEGVISNVGAEKRTGLSKTAKIIIAVVVSVIVALLALIIINSAVISNINNDISSLQSSLTTVKDKYTNILGQFNPSSIVTAVEQFAKIHGMVK